MVSSTPRPHFTPGKDPVPILQEAGWASGPVWTGRKSRPHRDSIPDRPARCQSLYGLSYPAHKLVHLVGFIIRIYHDARSPERRIWDISFDMCLPILHTLLSTQTTFKLSLQYSSSWRFHNFRNTKRLTGFHTALFVQASHFGERFLVLAASTLLAAQNN